ncbi:MAG: replicative DNA helicase [Gammaproteobacteria bacterium]|nr:replicative DNA helicase [Gammaproteobacteria bacterium]
MSDIKLPPHSVEAEQSVLGGLLLDIQAWDQISDKLEERDFYRVEHKYIFRLITEMVNLSKPVDVITLAESLEAKGLLDKAGGLPYIGALATNVPSAANIVHYSDIVRDKSVLRNLAAATTEIATSIYKPDGRSPDDLLESAEQQIFAIAESRNKHRVGFQSINPLLTKVLEKVETIMTQDSRTSNGLESGFKDLDEMTTGFQPADLIIIAARPSMGKTSLAMNIAENVAIDQKKPVAIFSMEMPGEQLAMRILASIGKVNQQKLRTATLDDDDWCRMTHALSKLHDAPIFIDETPALSATDLRSRARRLHREQGGLGLVVIDYLQLMSGSHGKQSDNRANEVAEISRSLKALAKELNVPVIALSQLNRSLEKREDKRPVMSDLRESGGIEQDADLILFIYREEVYDKNTMEKGKAEIIISKQRNGPIGIFPLTFRSEYTRFENYAKAEY